MTLELNILVLFREGVDIQITEPRSKAKYKGTLKNIYNEVNTLTDFKIGNKKLKWPTLHDFKGCPFCACICHNRKVCKFISLIWVLPDIKIFLWIKKTNF